MTALNSELRKLSLLDPLSEVGNRWADRFMLKSKNAGRNRVTIGDLTGPG